MTQDDYELFRGFLESACGIVLGEDKHYLVSSRLTPLLSEFGIPTVGALVAALRTGGPPTLRDRIVDAMTTNETLWFRDGFPFEILKSSILPELAKMRAQAVRIWSAACSSGQEPYSISMAIEEYQQANPGALTRNVQITATDISPSMLAQARAGVYESAAMSRGLSEQRRQRFFVPKGPRWEIRDELRRRVTFKELNLLQGYESLGKFHMIFCRNVLIYFSPELKRDILARFAEALLPGGYLFLGAAESITNHSDAFEMVRSPLGIAYRLRRNAHSRQFLTGR